MIFGYKICFLIIGRKKYFYYKWKIIDISERIISLCWPNFQSYDDSFRMLHVLVQKRAKLEKYKYKRSEHFAPSLPSSVN